MQIGIKAMRRRFYFALVLLVLGICLGRTAAAEGPGAMLSATPQSAVVGLGDEIILDVSLRNVSPDALKLSVWPNFSQGEYDYRVEMTRSDGGAVGRRKSEVITGNIFYTSVKLNPGDEIREEIDLGSVFDISAAGVYTVRVSRMISGNPESMIYSNFVNIEVH